MPDLQILSEYMSYNSLINQTVIWTLSIPRVQAQALCCHSVLKILCDALYFQLGSDLLETYVT